MSEIKLIRPDFDSPLQDAILELEHLRKLPSLSVTTPPQIFLQLKDLFHKLESLGSARIEGNRTTLSQYLSAKRKQDSPSEQINEVLNIENALTYIDKNLKAGDPITEIFIRELHQIVVGNLEKEGDRTPGAYRDHQVYISGSCHIPPNPSIVPLLVNELVSFINRKDAPKYDLLKVAIAHHRFGWIHPFGNGNGRTVRLLTYAMLLKYEFNIGIAGRILNPTAVFCCDRDKYYQMLSIADKGTDEDIETWCNYVLQGILEEWKKLDVLRDYEQVKTKILFPAVKNAHKNAVISEEDQTILLLALNNESITAADVSKELGITPSRATYKIRKLKENHLLETIREKSREYTVSLSSHQLIHGVINQLDEFSLIPHALLTT